MHRVVASLIAGVIATSSTAKAVTRTEIEDSFNFAVMRTPAWALTATTSVNWPFDTRYPTVARVDCTGESRQFAFNMSNGGAVNWLRVKLLGKADKDGEQEEITLLGDRVWIYIDGERWEYANIPAHSTEFSNIRYPPPESDIILPVWRGYQAVRQAEDEPWINLSLIYHRLITARQIEWSFKSRDWAVVDKESVENQLPKNWGKTRYKIDNDGLRYAISWCARQVSSEDAYILPTRIRERSNETSKER